MELLETALRDLERQEAESLAREKALLNSLEKQERAFTRKLEQLCQLEPNSEGEPSELEERLSKLEKQLLDLRLMFRTDTEKLVNNQAILSKQLSELSNLLR